MAIGRRIRGLLGIATTWGVAFSALATTIFVGGLVAGVIPGSVFGPREVLAVAVRAFIAGGIAGGVFASLFAGAERRRTMATLSPRRVALWGFLGTAILPGLVVAVSGLAHPIPLAVLAAGTLGYGAIGAAMSVMTIRIARRAPELPAGDEGQVGRLPPAI